MKLAEIQSKVKAPKDLFNSFGKYNYRSCESILEAVKLVVNPLGYSITLTDEVLAIGNRIYVKATAILTNGTEKFEVSAFAREEETKKGMDSAQITGAASSYARKYALNGLFAIDDTKDADSTNNHKEEVKEVVKPVMDIKHPNFIKACKGVQEGEYTIEDIEKKYTLSQETKNIILKVK